MKVGEHGIQKKFFVIANVQHPKPQFQPLYAFWWPMGARHHLVLLMDHLPKVSAQALANMDPQTQEGVLEECGKKIEDETN